MHHEKVEPMPARRSSPKYDPFWDLEGPAARREWRRRKFRRIEATLAWLDVVAMSVVFLRAVGH